MTEAGGPRPSSTAEYRAEIDGVGLPPTAPVRPGLWVLPQPMPAQYSPRYTLSYLIQDARGGIHLVDPGWDDDENLARLDRALVEIGSGPERVVSVTATHQHADHLGLAERLRREREVPVALHSAEQTALRRRHEESAAAVQRGVELSAEWGVPTDRRAELAEVAERTAETAAAAEPFTADRLLESGERLAVPGRSIRVLHTPGHTPGHLCLVDDDERLLFTGDHLLPAIFPGLGLGGATPDALGDYLRSLDSIEGYHDHGVLPGHGFRFTGLAERVDVTRRHHLRRSAEVAAIVAEHPGATVWETAEQVTWTAGWANLHGFYLRSALAQTAMHRAYLERAGASTGSA